MLKRSAVPSGSILINWKEGVKKIMNKWGVLEKNKEESPEVHPLTNCRWEITTFNFLLQKKTSFFLHIHENGTVKMSDDVQGTWVYSNYYLTWIVEHEDRRVFYTAELLWNGDKSKLVKGIIYEEKKGRRFFLPAYFFRKILGSFEGRVSVESPTTQHVDDALYDPAYNLYHNIHKDPSRGDGDDTIPISYNLFDQIFSSLVFYITNEITSTRTRIHVQIIFTEHTKVCHIIVFYQGRRGGAFIGADCSNTRGVLAEGVTVGNIK
ncbi:hypothetical protein AK88_04016 [Plasmodium fragile]|uniref:Uncharacterized protein n=1 Tax=Plasmodium fragile TaxID=5857 RepID=A0A0D9QHM9_PLAFR|nr:uncharacterized protein AK88_04016 [Plasmodium fragile]KJP86297.1 hypothetical protein AK88_04016 [Plasmodium fragile]